MKLFLFFVFSTGAAVQAQESSSGFDLRATVSASTFLSRKLEESPRSGSPVAVGFRSLFYPTWKLNNRWSISGVIQVHSRPLFLEEYHTQGYGIKTDILQANLNYSRAWKNKSLMIRMGQLSSAFGSFLLRYDDFDNALVDVPMTYGYYYKPVSTLGLTGAQVDLTVRKWDMRAQFVNSSPANRRSIFDRDQYGNWAGGVGYTIEQGFRVGASAYRGPYLDRKYAFFFPGEAKPRDLPATAVGIDAQWARRHWNIQGEWQHFEMTYRAIPNYRQQMGYFEARRVLHPRWYLATRTGYYSTSASTGRTALETVAGYRPNARQLIKFGYQIQHNWGDTGGLNKVATIEIVTSFHALSVAAK